MIFELATCGDEGEIRRLLRENPIGGGYSISLEREPVGFGAAQLTGERNAFILAREAPGTPAVGLCERVVRPAFVDGEEALLPYLGALRVAASHRGRLAILKGGFAALRGAERADECSFALTSITHDNHQARRILTAGLAGLPAYRPIGGYSTLVLRPRRGAGSGIAEAGAEHMEALAHFLGRRLRLRQFAPRWSAGDLRRLQGATFLVALAKGAIVGCVSLWDQRSFRQTVIRGYPPAVDRLRPAINLTARIMGMPQLPRVGSVLPQAFLSHLAAEDDDPRIVAALIRSGLDLALRRGLTAVVLGVPCNHPWKALVKATYRTVEYRTALYTVRWPDSPGTGAPLRDMPAFPDVGLL